MPVESNLPSSPAVFDSFEPYFPDDIEKIISTTPTKYRSLEPLPTHIMKEFLPEVLSFIVDMCNTSLEEGWLPLSQRHAIVTPHLKKADADQSDVKKLSSYFKSDVHVKIISFLLMAVDREQVTILGLLDLSTAFDTVDHIILINRLRHSLGIQGVALSWIESPLISNRT